MVPVLLMARHNNNNTNIVIRRKKRESMGHSQAHTQAQWKSEARQWAYSSKLLKAIARSRLRSGAALRESADMALAATAKGRTRWSRAILASRRLKVKFRNQRIKNGPRLSRKSTSGLKGQSLLAVQGKVKVLRRLVPGCKKEQLPVVLEEATDYIAALEMQVRAMTVLAQILSGDTSSAGSARKPPHPFR